MVKHRHMGEEWWCLPGGGLEPGETPEQGTLRELREECNVDGTIIRQTSVVSYAPDDQAYTYLVDIADQEPSIGHDPEFAPGEEVLADVRWLRLGQIPERDRAFLWAAGLLGAGTFLDEVDQWGDEISYPGEAEPHHPAQAAPNDAPDG
jgi:ADP-ribose pyrophosphatase YjhB (NUDIX family)